MATADTKAHDNPANGKSKTAGPENKDRTKELDAEIAALREDIAAITETLSDMVKQSGDDVRSQAHKVGDRAVKTGEHAFESARHNYEHAEDEIKTMIRDKPITSVLVAAGAGYILSKVLRI